MRNHTFARDARLHLKILQPRGGVFRESHVKLFPHRECVRMKPNARAQRGVSRRENNWRVLPTKWTVRHAPYDCMLDHWKRRDSGASGEDTLALPLRTSGKEETWPCGPQSGAPGLSRALTVAPRRNWLLCQNGGSRRRSSKTRAKTGNFDLELPSVVFDSSSRKIWE